MNTPISKFMKKHYTDTVYHTHVSMDPNSTGKYQLNRESFEKLMMLYCDTLYKNPDKNMGSFAEKSRHHIPILADIDLKIKLEEGEEIAGKHIYTEKNLLDVVSIYQNVIRSTLEGCTDDNLLCVVLEKDIYHTESKGIRYCKNGFHLHFPNCFLARKDIENHIVPRVRDLLKDEKVFEDLGFEDSSSVLDKGAIKNAWLLYGSSKEESMKPYIVTKVIDSNGNKVELENAFKYYQIFDDKENLINIRGKVKYYLPRILSIDAYGRTCYELKQGLPSPFKEKENKKMKDDGGNSSKKNFKKSVTESLKIAERLLPMLSQDRADDFEEWMNIGWILYSIGDGCLEAYDLWNDFSQRSEKYDEAACEEKWEKMFVGNYTLGTLRWMAEKDNKDKYEEFKNEMAQDYVIQSLEGSHYDIAKLLFNEHGTRFKCSSIKNRVWWEFKNHHWKEIEEGVDLRRLISEDLVEKYAQISAKLSAKTGSPDKAEGAMYQIRLKQAQKILTSLRNSNFKNSVMRECCEVFYDENFKDRLDMNEKLFGFKNGIYDLTINKFRAGKPDDYISKHSPVNYREFSQDDSYVKQIEGFFEKVFPDKSVRKYFLDTASDVFEGGNHQKVVLFWTGEGNGGKSVTQTMFEKMLGEYAIKFSTTLITGKKGQTGNASPEMARAGGGVRWAVFEEPDSDEQINIGLLKSLSGNDSYWARDLFEKGKGTREITPLFKMGFICNRLPNFRGCTTDGAAWNRVKVVPFEAEFIKKGDPTRPPAPDTIEEQFLQKRFPMDTEFGKKIPGLLEPLAWYLLEHRKSVVERFEPEKVTIATRLYKKKNDTYRQFIDECIIEDAKARLSLKELYTEFKEWYKESNPQHSLPVRDDVKDYFEKLWDEPEKGNVWLNYRMRTEEDDLRDGTIVILGDDDLIDYSNKDKGSKRLLSKKKKENKDEEE